MIVIKVIALLVSATVIAADCPGPFDDHDRCENKIQWTFNNRDSTWFVRQGLDGSRCSIQGYMAKRGFCPSVESTNVPTAGPLCITNKLKSNILFCINNTTRANKWTRFTVE